MQPLLKQAMKHLDAGWAAQSDGRLEEARSHYLQGAQALLQAATASSGNLKERRAEMAERLMDHARALERQMRTADPSTAPSRRAPPLPVADGADGAAFVPVEQPSVRFADVAGLEDAIDQIRIKMVYPFTHPEQAQRFGVKSGGGLLLHGPPGTGKTLLARAVAGEIDAPFFSVKPSEVMSKWVGQAEQNIDKLFATARSYPRALIFIDEVEALVPKRRSSGSTVMQRVVPQILAELEGFEEKEGALLFIGATNEPWALDPAVLRPGRFDERIYVPLPDLTARRRILGLNLRDRPLAADVDLDALADMLAGYSGADIANMCRKACAIPFIEAVEQGVERDVNMADFQQVMGQVSPSVSRQEVARYEKYVGGA